MSFGLLKSCLEFVFLFCTYHWHVILKSTMAKRGMPMKTNETLEMYLSHLEKR